jgi:hypothetical protein
MSLDGRRPLHNFGRDLIVVPRRQYSRRQRRDGRHQRLQNEIGDGRLRSEPPPELRLVQWGLRTLHELLVRQPVAFRKVIEHRPQFVFIHFVITIEVEHRK